mgnify:CR=1 FL=1
MYILWEEIMNYILYRIETYGIKNISNLISFDFSNQTVTNKIKKNQSKIKAIYGTNGAGKSAFMNAIEIYKQLNLDYNYLKQNENIKKLNKILNKNDEKNKKFYFSVIYGEVENDKIINVFKHQILIKIDNEIPYIGETKVVNGKGRTIAELSDKEDILEAEIDKESLVSFRNYFTVHRDWDNFTIMK